MQVVYANQPFPRSFTRALFLAGPTPRSAAVSSWRPDALRILSERGYDGAVFVPESATSVYAHDYLDQVEWVERNRQPPRLSVRSRVQSGLQAHHGDFAGSDSAA